eukprot:Ihof_evm8s98 gene=Ihof_evmTU8s98
MARFEDHFWGIGVESEWVGPHHGFEVMVKRLRESKTMSEAFIDVCKQRAALEKAYGDGMLKLATIVQKDNHGNLKVAWDTLMAETTAIGQTHCDLSKVITNEVVPDFKSFAEEQRITRKMTVENFQKHHAARAKAYEKMIKSRKDFEVKSKEMDQAESSMNNPPPNHKPKELDKAKAKYEKHKQMAVSADANYRDALAQLDEQRLLWEAEYQAVCNRFQALEETRVDRMKVGIIEIANQQRIMAEADIKNANKIGEVAKDIYIDIEIETLIADCQTGTFRPPPILYRGYEKTERSSIRRASSPVVAAQMNGGSGSREDPIKRACSVPTIEEVLPEASPPSPSSAVLFT